MKNYLHLFALTAISFLNIMPAQGQNLASSPTISFTNSTGFEDNIAQDGEGGSVSITDFNLQVYPINSSGTKLTGSPLEYHNGGDWPGYPELITYGDWQSHYGWVVKSDNGNNFSLQSLSFMDWGDFAGYIFVIQAFNDNVALGSVNFFGNNNEDMVVLSSPGVLTSIFHNVDEVRIYRLGGANTWTGLNHIRVSSPAVVLPVQGLVFNASLQVNGVYLQWQTLAEQGTKNFVIQRSTNGNVWSEIGTVQAAMNSVTTKKYQWIDYPGETGIYQYRLQLNDLDGSKTYSQVYLIDYSASADELKVYSNPVMNGRLQFTVSKNVSVKLYNATGKMVFHKNLTAGTHEISLPQQPKGVYYLKAGNSKQAVIFQ